MTSANVELPWLSPGGSATCVLISRRQSSQGKPTAQPRSVNHNYRSKSRDVGLGERPIRGARMSKDRRARSLVKSKNEESLG